MAATDSRSLLDYGCGQGTLARALQGRVDGEVAEYDPGVPGKDMLPSGQYDIVTATDVLEHIEPDKLNNVLQHIGWLAGKCIYFLINTKAASLNLTDGRNAHLIVKPAAWWLEKIRSAYGCKVSMGNCNDSEVEIVVDKTKPAGSIQKPLLAKKGGYPCNVVTDADFFDLWHGKQCLIIGSGRTKDYLPFNPALNGFPGKIIGCNSAFTVGYRTDMIMFVDRSVIDQHGPAMAVVDCLKLSIACDPPMPWDLHGNEIYWLLARQPERFSRSFNSGLYPADLTGFLALNTALLMGCNPVWLYGFYAEQHEYNSKMERFRWASQWAEQNGREIYVTDEDSLFCKGANPVFEYKHLPLPEMAETEE